MKLVLLLISLAALAAAGPQFENENLQHSQNLPAEEHHLSFESHQHEFENPQQFESPQHLSENPHQILEPQPVNIDNQRPSGIHEHQPEGGQRFVANQRQNFEAHQQRQAENLQTIDEDRRSFISPEDRARFDNNQRGVVTQPPRIVEDRRPFAVSHQQSFGVPQQVEIHRQPEVNQRHFDQVPRHQADEIRQRPIAILRDDREDLGNGEFAFSFETENGISESRRGFRGSEGQTNMEGFFSFPLPDGTFAEVRYVADENGFRAESPLIPTPHPLPAHAIEQIRIAEEQRARGITWPDY
ncbi:uncharacterized protein LOC135200041 [Macrobrachium nipponense]|uniref:uncharacterized protein LOC135200041 n=1 Tax=Macrobrachium nipponense TaxID=159736 RepID=UPI0030C88309